MRLALLAGPALAVALLAAWLVVDPRTPDLAAQVYRVGLFRQLGLAIWDEHWYAGHHLPGYSLLFGPFGALLGVRAAGALCALASSILFARLAAIDFPRGAGWGAAAFSVAAVGDVWLGRLAFVLGVALALAAGLALRRGHPLWGALLAACSAAASPVAGLLLALAGLTVSTHQRSARGLLVLAAPGAAIVLPLVLLFPEGGSQPFPLLSFAVTAAAVLAFLLALPAGAGLLRVGGLVYLLACLACLLASTPIGSNIERYGVLLAGPLLVCALLEGEPGRRASSHRIRPAGALALALIATWVLWGPVRETAAVDGSPATRASYYLPLEGFLNGLHGGPVRVEVPLTRSHWEAAMLAARFSLARGWEKQLDQRYDGVLLGDHLTAQAYRRWLQREAVAYVAVPDVQPDPSSAAEGRLISAGLPYLREVFASRHWRVFAVIGAAPLATAPGRVTALGHDSFSIQFDASGRSLVRVHFSRYLTVTRGSGCVSQGPGDFTTVLARSPGELTVTARFSLSRAFGSSSSCSR